MVDGIEMNVSDTAEQKGFEFPGRFELSAMGAADAQLERRVPETLAAMGVQVEVDSLRIRPSSKGNYVAVAVAFQANSREQYDAAHAALRALPAVKWTI